MPRGGFRDVPEKHFISLSAAAVLISRLDFLNSNKNKPPTCEALGSTRSDVGLPSGTTVVLHTWGALGSLIQTCGQEGLPRECNADPET